MLRYTVLRLLIFFGFTLLFWLVGLRNDTIVLVILAALASSVTSYVLLRGMRDEMTAKLVARHEARVAARHESEDELAEDAEAEAAAADGAEGDATSDAAEPAAARGVIQAREVAQARGVAEVPEAADRRRRQPRDEPA